MKPVIAGKLYKKIKQKVERRQFEQFLLEFDANNIQNDYHHIRKSHINNGNNITIKNTFIFFQIVVHYEDTPIDSDKCRSVNRRKVRMVEANLESKPDDMSENMNSSQNKNISALKQHYIQNELDMIHSYLVHSNWKDFVQKYSSYNEDDDKEQDASHLSVENNEQQKSKYMTYASKSDITDYGFGVQYEYPYLSPTHCSLEEDMLCNTLHPITQRIFKTQLIKAIKKHKEALLDGELKCKYFNAEYNILRNDPIGIKHILVLIIYTDLSKFCTAFRKTYRRTDEDTNDVDVTRKHRQLYYYSRFLFEAVEFFGKYMNQKLKVYHGLNRVMQFEQFTAYFNQPISTTKALKIAKQFSDSQGIIVTLKSGAEYFNESTKIPKYLSVSWLSDFPNEEEMLFYGLHIVFQIDNIIEAENMKHHSKELIMLNKFQKMVQNRVVKWDEGNEEEKKMIEALVILIQKQQNINMNKWMEKQHDEDKDDEKEQKYDSEYITEYGHKLFCHFSGKITVVGIKQYESFPSKIQNILFKDNTDNMKSISLIEMTKLFPCLTKFTLNDLEIGEFTKNARCYIDSVREYIEYNNNRSFKKCDMKLEKIKFQSKQQNDRKMIATLKNLSDKDSSTFNKDKWAIEYSYQLQDRHCLTFINLQQTVNRLALELSEMDKQFEASSASISSPSRTKPLKKSLSTESMVLSEDISVKQTLYDHETKIESKEDEMEELLTDRNQWETEYFAVEHSFDELQEITNKLQSDATNHKQQTETIQSYKETLHDHETEIDIKSEQFSSFSLKMHRLWKYIYPPDSTYPAAGFLNKY